MSKLYFKDSNGEFCPIDISYLDLKPNQIVFLQIEDDNIVKSKIDALLEVLENIVDPELTNTEFVVVNNKIKIDIVEKDKDWKSSQILIDMEDIKDETTKSYLKDTIHAALKRYHHEFVKLPIKISGTA